MMRLAPSLRRPAAAQLWQVPVFLLGIAAVVEAALWCPLWRDPDLRRLERQLAEVRSSLLLLPSDAQQALSLEADILEQIESFPQQAGEALFLLGSIHLRVAETAAGTQAQEHAALARRYLERADSSGVPETLRPQLSFQLVKAWHLTGANPEGVIARLTALLDQSTENAAESYTMLAQAYQSLPTPELQRALETLRGFLALPTASETLLAPARLQQGEILIRMEKLEEANSVLSRIGDGSPPPVRARARVLRAEIHHKLGDEAEAAKLWQEVLADTQQPPPKPGEIRFALGRSYLELEQREQAAQAWQAALSAGGEVEQAAALALGELALGSRQPAGAVPHFERALRAVAGPADYHNKLADVTEARQRLKSGNLRLREVHDYPNARRVVDLLARIDPSAEMQELRGQTEEGWADFLVATQNGALAGDHYRDAGAAYAEAADSASSAQDRARRLRRAAAMFRQARDYPKSLEILKHWLSEESSGEWRALAHYERGEIYNLLRDPAGADEAYRKCIEYQSPVAFKARFRLAESDIRSHQLDDALAQLQQCLELLSKEQTINEDPIASRVRYALADVFHDKGEYLQASFRYLEALQREPHGPAAPRARLRLAASYRHLAQRDLADAKAFAIAKTLVPSPSSHSKASSCRSECRKNLMKAQNELQALRDELAKRGARGALSDEEQQVQRQLSEEAAHLASLQHEVSRLPSAP